MIVTPYFVYLHHPKTGGTFVTKMLYDMQAKYPDFKIIEPQDLKHAGRRKIPEAYAHLPIVTNIRYLLDHYVSRYEFAWWKRPGFFRPEVRKEFPNYPKLDFGQFMRAFCNWHYRDIDRNKATDLVNSNIGVNTRAITRIVGINNIKLLVNQDGLSDSELQQNFDGIHFLRSHRLNQDLAELIQKCGKDKGIEYDTSFILDSQRVLPKLGGRGGKGKNWQSYFDDELLDFVLLKDRLLLRSLPWLLEEFPAEAQQRFDKILLEYKSDTAASGSDP